MSQHIKIHALHKSGSMFLYKLSKDLAAALNIPLFSINNTPPDNKKADPNQKCIICPNRHFPSVVVEKDLYLFVLRNPLDILVSEYYSFGWTHPPSVAVNKIREKIQKITIDEYAIGFKEILFKKYEPIFNIIKKPNVIILQYVDMVLYFDVWLSDLCGFLSISDHDRLRLIEKFREEFTNAPNISHDDIVIRNIRAHKRRMIPGDYLEKLKPETIAILTDYFLPIINICKSKYAS